MCRKAGTFKDVNANVAVTITRLALIMNLLSVETSNLTYNATMETDHMMGGPPVDSLVRCIYFVSYPFFVSERFSSKKGYINGALCRREH